jgi:CelD/BcsL family acetyltransferase involved in cellulose biosynthesis
VYDDSDRYRTEIEKLPADRAPLRREWLDLEARSRPSFFRSWAWIGTWTDHVLPPGADARIVRVRHVDGATVALGILAVRTEGSFPLGSRTGWLHETGIPSLDRIAIEWNGLLADADHEDAALHAAMQALAGAGGLTRLVLGGVDERQASALPPPPPGWRLWIERTQPSYVLHLPPTQDGGATLDALLSANSRQQVRRASRAFASAFGPVAVAAAGTADEAQSFLSALKPLHQHYWRERGVEGAFSSAAFERFHRALIERHFGDGSIDLLHVTAGRETVGYLYNFRYRGRVYAYQSGFDYALLPKASPGMLCHWLAIERACQMGDTAYDFLAGDNQLKRQLSTETETMAWLSLEQPGVRRWVRKAARKVSSLWRAGKFVSIR